MTDNLQFRRWVPSDGRRTLMDFYSVVCSCDEPKREGRYMLQYMLERLARRPKMEAVWAELKRFERVTPGGLIAAIVVIWISAIIGATRMTKDVWARLMPVNLATHARIVAEAMQAEDPEIRTEEGISETTLTELARAAAFFERDADFVYKALTIAPPPRKARARNAHQIAFVNRMCDWLWQRSGRRPYTLVAILANVVFDVPEHKEWSADRVKHCYRSRSRTGDAREH